MLRRFGDPVDPRGAYVDRPGAYALIRDGGDLLLTEQSAPEREFQLPGGGIDPGEGTLAALHRECLEETGWRIRVERRLGAFQPTHQHRQFLAVARLVIAAQQMTIGVGDRHGQASGGGPVAMHVQLAERRIAFQHLQWRVLVEMALELFGADVLDGVQARLAREQARTGEFCQYDAHVMAFWIIEMLGTDYCWNTGSSRRNVPASASISTRPPTGTMNWRGMWPIIAPR